MTDHYIHPRKKHRRITADGPEFIPAGEPFVPTDAELASYGDVLEPFEEAGDDVVRESDEDPADDADAGDVPVVGELSVSEVRDYIQGVDDVDHLDRMYDDEAEGEARTTAMDAIEARIRALSGGDEDEHGDA